LSSQNLIKLALVVTCLRESDQGAVRAEGVDDRAVVVIKVSGGQVFDGKHGGYAVHTLLYVL